MYLSHGNMTETTSKPSIYPVLSFFLKYHDFHLNAAKVCGSESRYRCGSLISTEDQTPVDASPWELELNTLLPASWGIIKVILMME